MRGNTVSQDEGIATIIREAFQASLASHDEDPGAIERVGRGVGAALDAPDDAVIAVEPEDRKADPIHSVRGRWGGVTASG